MVRIVRPGPDDILDEATDELGWHAQVDPTPGGFICGVATLTKVR